jgi:hypothetical protein
VSNDAQELRQLVERYAFGCDHQDEALLRSVFVDGAVLNVHRSDRPSTMTMPDDVGRIPKGLSRYDHTFHFVGNHRCEVDGDSATGETYCFAHHVTGTDNFVMTIRYEDQYVRTADGWRIKQRDLRLLWTSNETVTPN